MSTTGDHERPHPFNVAPQRQVIEYGIIDLLVLDNIHHSGSFREIPHPLEGYSLHLTRGPESGDHLGWRR